MSASSTAPVQTPLLSNGIYAILKHTAMILLPASAALYVALAPLWHFPNPEAVAGSIAAVNTFLGLLVGISSQKYNNSDAKYDGELFVGHSDGVVQDVQVSLSSKDTEAKLPLMKNATFKVVPRSGDANAVG